MLITPNFLGSEVLVLVHKRILFKFLWSEPGQSAIGANYSNFIGLWLDNKMPHIKFIGTLVIVDASYSNFFGRMLVMRATSAFGSNFFGFKLVI
jgi:hypothetical protein